VRRQLQNSAIISTLLSIATISSALAVDNMAQGKLYYDRHDYKKAFQYYSAEVTEHPNNAAARYLLGNVLVEQHETSEAADQYKAAVTLDPTGTAGIYASKALVNMTISAVKAGEASQASAETPAQSEDGKLLKRSVRKISAETTEAERVNKAEYDKKMSEVMRDSDRKVADLQREMQEQIAANGQAQYAAVPVRFGNRVSFNRSRTIQTYSPEEANAQVRAEFNPKIEAVKADAARKAEELTTAYKEKESVLEDQATRLDMQYLNKTGSSGIKLAPMGTSSFVRNFESTDEASGAPIPVQAKPAKSLKDVKKTGN
jgi:tetratricopeptide (TPR) repeat protein